MAVPHRFYKPHILAKYSGWIEGQERRKYGVENEDDGLLLLLALILELVAKKCIKVMITNNYELICIRNTFVKRELKNASWMFSDCNSLTIQVDFYIDAALLAEQPSLKATASSIAFNSKKSEDYEYCPTIKLTNGRKMLRAKTDYEVTYVNCTQKAVTAYLITLSNSILTGQSYEQMRPYARIEAKEGGGYQGSMIVDLTIYNTKLTASNLYVVIAQDVRQTTYSGRQVTPEVTVYYGEKQAVRAARQVEETSDAVLTIHNMYPSEW